MLAETLLGIIFPWTTTGILFLFVVLNLLFLPRFVKHLLKTPKIILLIAIAAIAGGVYLRFAFVPNQHRIFYDEDRYLGYSVSFARLNQAVSVEAATPEKSVIGKPDQAVRVTVPVLHGWILKLFGYQESNLFNASRVVSVLLAIYLSVLSYMLFRSYLGSLLTLVGMLYLPILVYWSASMALDPYFVFFTVTSFVSLALYLKGPSFTYALFVTTSVFLLLCVRIEAFILLPLFLYFAMGYRKSRGEILFQSHDKQLLIMIIPLILARGIASLSVLGEKWCCADSLPLESFSAKYITRNTLPNLMYLVTGFEFPYVLSLPALWLGLTSKSISHRLQLFWIVSFFLLYSFYYAGLFVTAEFSGSYGRYFLILIPPLILLYSDCIASYIVPNIHKAKRYVAGFILLVALTTVQLGSNFWHYKDLVIYAPTMFNAVDQGPVYVHAYLEQIFLPAIPKDAVVIHPITAIPLLHGHPTVYYQYFLEDDTTIEFVKNQLKSGRRVFTMNAFECKAIPHKCRKIEKLFAAKHSDLNKAETSNIFQIYEVFLK